MKDIEALYEILGLEYGASWVEVRQSYRDLAKVWHPDRFQNDPRLQKKAEEEFKRINFAYEQLRLRIHPKEDSHGTPRKSPDRAKTYREPHQRPRKSKTSTISRWQAHDKGVIWLGILEGGHRAVSAGVDHKLRIWNLESGIQESRADYYTGPLGTVTVSADGKNALYGGSDHKIIYSEPFAKQVLIDAPDYEPKILRVLKGHTGWIRSVALSPDRRYALSGSDDGTVRVWNLENGLKLRRETHRFPVGLDKPFVSFSADGQFAMVAGMGRGNSSCPSAPLEIHAWELAGGRQLRADSICHSAQVRVLRFSPDLQYLACGERSGAVTVWKVSTGSQVCRFGNRADDAAFDGRSHDVDTLAFSPDGNRLVSGSMDGAVSLWDIRSGYEIGTYEGHDCCVLSSAFSPDGSFILSGDQAGTICVWAVPV